MIVLVILAWLTAAPENRTQTAPAEPDTRVECGAPPEFADVHPRFRETVREMWLRSPTFRRQLARLSAQSALRVSINPWPGWRTSSSMRARTTVSSRASVRRADVEVGLLNSDTLVEVIAHEVEHILEQLDGVDLSRSIGRHGVSAPSPVSRTTDLETERARSVGRAVAREFRAAPSVRCKEVQP